MYLILKENVIKYFSYLFILISFSISLICTKILLPQEIAVSGKIKRSEDGAYISREQNNQDVLHYEIHIELFPATTSISASVNIKMKYIDSASSRVFLNLYQNLTIDSISCNSISLNTYKLYNRSLAVELNKYFSPNDTFNLSINYHGSPLNLGYSSFKFGEINGNSLIATLSEPEFASTWLVCNDKPNDKALVDMYITNDKEKTSLSNGKLIETISTGNRKTFHWQTKYPISTYLICLYSSQYEQIDEQWASPENDTLQLIYYAIPKHVEKAKVDFKNHKRMLQFFSSVYGTYPFIMEKYGVAEFLWQSGAMENQTITGIGTNFIQGRGNVEDVLAHELAHHWWGNSVGPETWKDIWLNEGFATYSEFLYANFVDSTLSVGDRLNTYKSFMFDDPVYDPKNDMFSPTVYFKGAWIIHMLRNEIGDSLFFSVIHNYYDKYKYSNASTKDFINIAETVSGKSLTQYFDQWLFSGSGKIILDYKWKYVDSDSKKQLCLSLKQVQQGYPCYKFNIDVFITNPTNGLVEKRIIDVSKTNQTIDLDIDYKPSKIELDTQHKLLIELQESIN